MSVPPADGYATLCFGSDLDVLGDLDEDRTLFDQAALQGDLEDLLESPVHVRTTGGLRQARAETREWIEQ